MDERNQLLEGGFVAPAPREEQFGDLGGMLGNAAILMRFSPVQLLTTVSRFTAKGYWDMTSSARIGIVLLAIAQGLAGCGGSNAKSPSAPTVGPTAPSGAGSSATDPVTLADSGYVLDTAFKRLAGVRVDVVDGPQAGTSMITDASGQFPLTGTFARTDRFRVSKDGYITATQGFSTSSPEGKPWLIVYLQPLAPPVNIAGDYTLTFVADSACTHLPPEVRTRSYAATVTPGSSATGFVLAATGASFLNGLTGFGIGVAGDSLGLWLHGGHDPALVEQLAPNTYLAFSGVAAASVGSSPVSTISTAFDGWIDYCVMSKPMASGYNCGTSNITGEPIPAAAVTYTHCQSPNHRLTLTRR